MMLITNPVFTEVEKSYLEFVLQLDFQGKSTVIDQLNTMNTSDITRDITPHYWIMEFRPNGMNAGHGPMHPYVRFEVIHESEIPSTVFTLYERNGVVFELEIFNADSSAMDLDAIMDGNVYFSDCR